MVGPSILAALFQGARLALGRPHAGRLYVSVPFTQAPSSANSGVDFPHQPSNNPPMPRPDAVRRVKSYSAADGYVYQYYFFEGNRAQRAAARAANSLMPSRPTGAPHSPSRFSSSNRPWTPGQS